MRIWKIPILTIVLLFIATSCQSAPMYDIEDVEFVRCRDGDTCIFNIKDVHPLLGDNIPVRFRNVDAPEFSVESCENAALSAYQEVSQRLISAKKISLVQAGRGKYFRILASVEADGVDLSTILLEKGLGLPYKGGKRPVHTCESG